ncbi:MAG: hypothetical protein MZV64_10000 [Ignavibacteriales bacterium]|nr:hypothetical protein [Ignavibacteriales bacterium]
MRRRRCSSERAHRRDGVGAFTVLAAFGATLHGGRRAVLAPGTRAQGVAGAWPGPARRTRLRWDTPAPPPAARARVGRPSRAAHLGPVFRASWSLSVRLCQSCGSIRCRGFPRWSIGGGQAGHQSLPDCAHRSVHSARRPRGWL